MLAKQLYEALENDRDELADRIGATYLDRLKNQIRADQSAWNATAAALEDVITLMINAPAASWHSLDGFVQAANLKSASARARLRQAIAAMNLKDPAAYTVANRVLLALGEPMPELDCTGDFQVKQADPLGCLRLAAEYGNVKTFAPYFLGLAPFAKTARSAALLLREFLKQSARLKTPPNDALSAFLKGLDGTLLEETLKLSPAFISGFAPKLPSRGSEPIVARAPSFASELDEEAKQRAEQALQLWAA